MKRVTPAEPFDPKPDAARSAILLDGFEHVLGARGVKAAGGRQQGRQEKLVAAQARD